MRTAAPDHTPDEELEAYSLDTLGENSLAETEEHLLVCDFCRARLAQIEPFNYIHFTEEGLVYIRVTRLATGEVSARHWGRDLYGRRILASVSAAELFLRESFSQMFPGHECHGRCGPAPGQLDSIS